ncbi:hypothetical protein PG984_005540 [Apiospora sp. TS-2023a]
MALPANRFESPPPQDYSTTPSTPDHKWFDLPIFERDQVWFGHLACVCHSAGGCDEHKETNTFHNPLLPPNAPMRLRQHGGQWHVLEKGDKSKSKHGYSGPLAFFQTLPSRIHKLLPPIFNLKNNSTPVDINSSSCTEQQTSPGSHPAPPPPQYSPIAMSTSRLPYYPGQISGHISWSAEDDYVAWGSDLPFDAASFEALAPIHPSIRYHLAFYHLNSVNRWMWPGSRMDEAHVIPSLICSGRCGPSRNNPGYNWSNELYLEREFLQKQEISYVLDMHSKGPAGIDITMFPHITVSLAHVRLRANKDGWLRASASITHKKHLSSKQRRALRACPTYQLDEERRNTYAKNVRWKSESGRLADLHSCKICHCDLERYLEVRGQQVHVRFTVYRNLGQGIDRFDPKWRSLLTGEGIPKPCPAFSVNGYFREYREVMEAAESLERPNLHWVAFRNANGDFTATPTPVVPRCRPKREDSSPPPLLPKQNVKL